MVSQQAICLQDLRSNTKLMALRKGVRQRSQKVG